MWVYLVRLLFCICLQHYYNIMCIYIGCTFIQNWNFTNQNTPIFPFWIIDNVSYPIHLKHYAHCLRFVVVYFWPNYLYNSELLFLNSSHKIKYGYVTRESTRKDTMAITKRYIFCGKYVLSIVHPWMFPPLRILLKYWIEHVSCGLLYVMFTFPTKIFYREIQALQLIVLAAFGVVY